MATWSFTAWNDEIPIVDHETRGLDHLLSQYGPDNAPRLRSWLATVLNGEASVGGAAVAPTGVQALENVAYQMLALRSIYTATGVNLDVLGRILGLERNAYSADDEIYRLLLLVKIMVNRSEATWDEINRMLVQLGLTIMGELEMWPATMRTEVADMAADPAGDAIWDLLRHAKAAGVRWDFIWSTRAEADIFTTAGLLGGIEDAILVDGDMELPGTGYWPSHLGGIVTKDPTLPHSGAQCLHVTAPGVGSAAARTSISPAGVGWRCRITGWARGDGIAAIPQLWLSSAPLWVGTFAAAWQAFDVTYTSLGTGLYLLTTGGPGWTEWDDLSMRHCTTTTQGTANLATTAGGRLAGLHR